MSLGSALQGDLRVCTLIGPTVCAPVQPNDSDKLLPILRPILGNTEFLPGIMGLRYGPGQNLLHVSHSLGKHYNKMMLIHLVNAARACIPAIWKRDTPPPLQCFSPRWPRFTEWKASSQDLTALTKDSGTPVSIRLSIRVLGTMILLWRQMCELFNFLGPSVWLPLWCGFGGSELSPSLFLFLQPLTSPPPLFSLLTFLLALTLCLVSSRCVLF